METHTGATSHQVGGEEEQGRETLACGTADMAVESDSSMSLRLSRPCCQIWSVLIMSNLPERLPHTLQITPIGVAAASAAPAGDASLSQYLQSVPSVGGSASPLGRLLLALADASAEIALILRGMHVAKTQTSNDFGDVQLNVDLATNEVRQAWRRRSRGMDCTCGTPIAHLTVRLAPMPLCPRLLPRLF